jgi:N-acetyl sugar amidotransferase
MIRICRTCLMPSSRPRVVFDDTGQCNACKWAVEKQRIDWDARAKEFQEVVAAHKRHPAYDCIVPFSGGKDSSVIAHQLKSRWNLKPLLVCYGQLVWTDVGRRNLNRVCDSGFDIVYSRVDQSVSRSLSRRFFIERGHPKQHYDAAVNAVPLITAVNFNIPLVIYAEHGETEYGGLVLDEESRRTRNLAEVLEHQVGDDARNWAVDGITERDLYPYIYPDLAEVERSGVKAFYFSHFFKWDIYENAKYARQMMGFEQVEYDLNDILDLADGMLKTPQWWGRSDGSFEGFDSIDDCIDDLDYWMMYLKFGFGRATRMASRLIQNGHLTREQGLELVKRYDGEPPTRYRTEICDYLGMSWDEIVATADLHRNPEIWMQENAEWKLRHPIL